MNEHTGLFQLGMGLAASSSTAQEEASVRHGNALDSEERKDFFVERNGIRFAGTHLIIDLVDACRLDALEHIRETLIDCVRSAGATLLHVHLHRFTPNGGVSGVAVLAESHISIHTWPERGYAAFDVFMCGDADPRKTIPVLERAFGPCRVAVATILRGEGL